MEQKFFNAELLPNILCLQDLLTYMQKNPNFLKNIIEKLHLPHIRKWADGRKQVWNLLLTECKLLKEYLCLACPKSIIIIQQKNIDSIDLIAGFYFFNKYDRKELNISKKIAALNRALQHHSFHAMTVQIGKLIYQGKPDELQQMLNNIIKYHPVMGYIHAAYIYHKSGKQQKRDLMIKNAAEKYKNNRADIHNALLMVPEDKYKYMFELLGEQTRSRSNNSLIYR